MNKSETAYKTVKSNILQNIYKPSQRLTEAQLALDLQVSRNTVRSILIQLEKEKLIVIEKNKGAYIKVLSIQEVKNILEIRALLESLIIEYAVENITESDLEKLGNIVSEMKVYREQKKFDDYSKANEAFHRIIYKASDKQEAVEMVKNIRTQIVRHQFRTILIEGRQDNSFKEHENIFKAIKDRDKKKAKEAIEIHIKNVSQTIENYYQYLV